MKKLLSFYLCLAAMLNVALVPEAMARGGRGGGGGGSRGGGGARAGGGMSRPSGGASRPSSGMSRGPTMSRPSAPAARPAPRPAPRPATRPSTPTARPSTRPSQPVARPGAGGGGVQRPGAGTLPSGTRPGGNTRPGAGGAGIANLPAQRPSASDLGNFLNLPERGPEAGNLPSNRPGDQAGNRPNERPGNVNDRVENRGDRTDTRGDRADNRQEWRSQLSDNAQTRQTERQDRADGVRDNWQDNRQDFWNEFQDDFGEPGWRLEYPHLAHGYFHSNHPYAHGWWTACTAAALTGWWASGWGEPAYYDYGSGGDVYYEEDTVYVDGQATATTEEYAAEAAAIAETGAEQLAAPVAAPAEEEWLPLGVFGLSTSAEEKTPTKFFQLAVNKEGVINGTYYNTDTKQNLPILGAVDRKTQRASWYVGDKKDTVMETAIYNLTKDHASALIHFGTERTEEYLLVRMDPPPEAAQPAAAPK